MALLDDGIGNDRWRKGGFWRIDDRDGSRQRNYDTRKEWNGAIVSVQDWEARQPQDFVKGKLDKQAVPDPRPVEAVENASFIGPQMTAMADDTPAGMPWLSVVSTAGFSAGDTIKVMLDNSESFITTLPIEPGSTNFVRNNSMQAAQIGTPGILPTCWPPIIAPGLAVSVAALGFSYGMESIDLSFAGTSTGASIVVPFETINQIAYAAGTSWSPSVFAALVAGSFAGIIDIRLGLTYYDGNGNTLRTLISRPRSINTSISRLVATPTPPPVNGFVQPNLTYRTFANQPINFTVRLWRPQMETGNVNSSPIRTAGTAVTRAAQVAGQQVPDPSHLFIGLDTTATGDAANVGLPFSATAGNLVTDLSAVVNNDTNYPSTIGG